MNYIAGCRYTEVLIVIYKKILQYEEPLIAFYFIFNKSSRAASG
jgi:hypothetical protein